MKPAGRGKGYEILRILENLNGESNAIKQEALIGMRRSGMHVSTYAHDCACKLNDKFEGFLCERSLLDGYHGSKHKCGLRPVQHSTTMNSQTCEQLWPRIGKLFFATGISRPHYRDFQHNCAKWRKHLVQPPQYSADVTPLASRRRLQRHGVA